MSLVRVGIWGVYGRGNYGNEAALSAFLEQLDRRTYSPVLLTEAPESASRLHGVPALRLGNAVSSSGHSVWRMVTTMVNRLGYLAAAIRAAGRLDAIVIAGSGGLERYGAGSFGTPFEVWSLAIACQVRRKPFILLDIGVEYLPRRLARVFARHAVRAATYRSYRDEASRTNARAMARTSALDDIVVTDMVFALDPQQASVRDSDKIIVGVMDYWGRDSLLSAADAHEAFVVRCVALIEDLIGRGRTVELVGGDDGDLEMARLVDERVDGAGLVIHRAETTSELTKVLSSAPVVIATRYHTLIMALLSGTPTVSIGYGAKHPSMLRQFHLPETHRDTESFDPAEVAELAIKEADDFATTSPLILSAVDDAKDRLNAQWPSVHRAMAARKDSAG
ncbi:polysaccharide pyruvyl transferase family protein [Humibacter soli]